MAVEITKYVVTSTPPDEGAESVDEEFTNYDDAIACALSRKVDPSKIRTIVEEIPEGGI